VYFIEKELSGECGQISLKSFRALCSKEKRERAEEILCLQNCSAGKILKILEKEFAGSEQTVQL
jgi:hypothetical protein